MRYVTADRDKAYKAHISLIGHLSKGDEVLLNEKEVTVCSVLEGTLEERAAQLGGEVLEYIDAMSLINEGGWQ
jgi:hypothetical protein